MKKLKIIFYSNGNVAVFRNNEQVPILQKSWFMLFVGFLVNVGLDPTQIDFILPDGKKAKISKTEKGYVQKS